MSHNWEKYSINMTIYILIPALNPGNTLNKLVTEIREKVNLPILIIDDGSNPKIDLQFDNCEIIQNDQNKGKGYSLKKGFEWGRKNKFNFAITLDADGQHSAKVLEKFININEKYDFVFGCREFSESMPFHRKLSNYLTSKFVSLRSGQIIKDSQCGFRRYNLDLIKAKNFIEDGFMFETEVILKSVNHSSKISHILIPTIYEDEESSIKNVTVTFNFITLYIRSFFW